MACALLLSILTTGVGLAEERRPWRDWQQPRPWTWGLAAAEAAEAGICGDSLLDPEENCDDGNVLDGDGCSSLCGVEAGWTCTLPVPPVFDENVVLDGSLELGPANPFWRQSGDPFTPICSNDTCGLPFATDGEWYAWFGALPEPGTMTLSQVVTIPPEATDLTFEFWVQKCDSLADVVNLSLDGNVVWTTDPCFAGGSYSPRSVDLTTAPGGPYNDGGDHTLLFRSDVFALNGFNSNFFMDEVSIAVPLDPPIDPVPSMCEQFQEGCFVENFEAGLVDWTRFNTGPLDLDWGTTDDGFCGSGVIPPRNYTGGVGEAACIDTDAAGPGRVQAYLCSPEIDLSTALEASLGFLYNFQIFNPGPEDFFEVWAGVVPPSPDTLPGPAYRRLFRTTVSAGIFLGDGVSESIDLSALQTRPAAWICFGYGADFDIYAQVDEVQVVADQCESVLLTTAGSCPGRAQVQALGATPGGRIAVIRGTGAGSSVVPAGVCAGTELSLADPQLVTVATADADGRVLFTPNLAVIACGIPIQILDLTTCTPTNLAVLP